MSLSKFLQGLNIIGLCTNLEDPQVSAFVLVGQYDDQLLATFYEIHYKAPPVGDLYKTDPKALQGLENLKNYIRGLINAVFNEAERQEQASRLAKIEQVRRDLAATNKVHEMGTVSEIAQKYGISKSEVRRRKAEGTLHELKV